MTQSFRITRSEAQIPSDHSSSQQPSSYQLLSHDFEDYFLDPDPNISTLGRLGVGLSLGISPFVAVIALLSGGCGGGAAGFSGRVQDGGKPPETDTDKDEDGYSSTKSSGNDCDDTNPRVNPKASEVCNGIDDNCDGQTDEEIGAEIFYTGAEGTGNRGECRRGIKRCIDGEWRVIQDEAIPGKEVCNGLDDDCDGEIDEEIDPQTLVYTGPEGTEDVGICRAETRQCSDGAFVPTEGQQEILPRDEEVCNGLDDDCDGGTDEGIAPQTLVYTGPEGTLGVGICEAGVQECIDGVLEETAEVLPGTEICNVLDDDCDGETDVWTRTHSGSADLGDVGHGIGVDPDGNIYVVGEEIVPGEDNNIWINKYDPAGNPLWDSPITDNGPVSEADSANSIAFDLAGNFYVTGMMTVFRGHTDIWINKYDPDGSPLWEAPITHDGPANTGDAGDGIAVGPDGNVYVTGLETISDQAGNIWINKYDSDGNPLWIAPVSYNGSANGLDRGHSIAFDPSGDFFVTGFETVSGQGFNIWTNKYDQDGNTLWDAPITYNGSNNGYDEGNGVAVDQDTGNFYVIGTTEATSGGMNIWMNGYDTDGNQLWPSPLTHNGPASGDDMGQAIAVLGGAIYVTGFESVSGQDHNVWINVYDLDGNPLLADPITHNGPISASDEGRAIAVNSEGHLHVTGFESDSGEGANIWIKKDFCTGP